MTFVQQKSSALSKKDKSSIGSWDKKILTLCEKINSLENFYTTSSCSGRIALVKNNSEQRPGALLKTYHKKISLEELKTDLEELITLNNNEARLLVKSGGGNGGGKRAGLLTKSKIEVGNNNLAEENKEIKFKQEPCILHIACKTLEDANQLLAKAKSSGFKRSGISSITKDKIILELISTEKIELPIISKGKILVDDNFLEVLVKEANKNLEKTWGKIKAFEDLIHKLYQVLL